MDYFKKNEISRKDANRLLDDYYDENGWEIERGIPTPDRLEELGLSDMIQDLPGGAEE